MYYRDFVTRPALPRPPPLPPLEKKKCYVSCTIPVCNLQLQTIMMTKGNVNAVF